MLYYTISMGQYLFMLMKIKNPEVQFLVINQGMVVLNSVIFVYTVGIPIPNIRLPELFSFNPKEAKQLLNGCCLVPPSKCRQNKAQI